MPIVNYDEMHAIFSFGLATGKFAKGSSEPLGMPPAEPSAEDAETQESNTVTSTAHLRSLPTCLFRNQPNLNW